MYQKLHKFIFVKTKQYFCKKLLEMKSFQNSVLYFLVFLLFIQCKEEPKKQNEIASSKNEIQSIKMKMAKYCRLTITWNKVKRARFFNSLLWALEAHTRRRYCSFGDFSLKLTGFFAMNTCQSWYSFYIDKN